MFEVFVTKTFKKSFDKLRDDLIKSKYVEIIEILENDPYNKSQKFKIRKLKNLKSGQWRIRIGDYRIRYDIEGDIVILYLVSHRKDIYKS